MIDAYGWRTMIGSIVPLSLVVLLLGVFMPVSYTHLDVYKRQIVRWQIMFWATRKPINS